MRKKYIYIAPFFWGFFSLLSIIQTELSFLLAASAAAAAAEEADEGGAVTLKRCTLLPTWWLLEWVHGGRGGRGRVDET